MNINQILKGKAIPLGVIITIIAYLVSGGTTSILPFVLFTGILIGLIKNEDVLTSAVAGFIMAFISSVITTIISVGFMYVSYGMAYVSYVLTNSLYIILFYLVVGAVGGVIGYYVSEELKN